MDSSEVAVMIRELRTSTSDANDLVRGVSKPQLDFVWKLTWILTLVMSIQTVKAERRPKLRILVMGHEIFEKVSIQPPASRLPWQSSHLPRSHSCRKLPEQNQVWFSPSLSASVEMTEGRVK